MSELVGEGQSYIYKARDKHDGEWEKEGQIFPASRPTRNREAWPASTQELAADAALKVRSGDDLLDRLIAQTQGTYSKLAAITSATQH